MNPFTRLLATGLVLAAAQLRASQAPLSLWPGTPPGETGAVGPEHDVTKPGDPLIAGRPVIRTSNVSDPTLTLYRPPAGKDTGAAVVVFPGGGYYVLALDLEGTEACDWLNSIGVTAVLVKYRVPLREGRPRYLAPLEDAQRAMGIIRLHSRDWGIDPNRLGVLGFSAGAHLCAVLSATPERSYAAIDAADSQSGTPDFQLLVYPGYLAEGGIASGVAPEARVSGRTPPTFMVIADDDRDHLASLLAYEVALYDAAVPVEAHLFMKGGHGFGLRPTADPVTRWPGLAGDWMAGLGVLARR